MRRVSIALFVLISLTSVIARAQAPAAPVYDARFVVGDDGATYTGTTTFAVDAKGLVTGALTIAGPLAGTGTLGGPVKDGIWSAHIDFTLPEQSCTGTLIGTATIPADQKAISGKAIVTSGCSQGQQDATFSFTRR